MNTNPMYRVNSATYIKQQFVEIFTKINERANGNNEKTTRTQGAPRYITSGPHVSAIR